tara:strand:+ start:225701 stop:226012 length:312 start_codon:yes stop_codon:yes gene_type:complete
MWIEIKDKLPPKEIRVLLYNEESDNYGLEFVHEYDLTTNRFPRNWTHWMEFIPPNTKEIKDKILWVRNGISTDITNLPREEYEDFLDGMQQLKTLYESIAFRQ